MSEQNPAKRNIPARPDHLPRTTKTPEEKDQLRAAFGQQLRTLLDTSQLSSQAFVQIYPAYKDSLVRKYLLGTQVPPWEFLRDLLDQVTRRTGDSTEHQRLSSELFTAYRELLVNLGADVNGSDQNSLLLRLYDGEMLLRQLGEELAEVREREERLHAEIRELQTTGGSGERVHQLQTEAQELAQRQQVLSRRRSDLVGDLDRTRTLLNLLEPQDDPAGRAADGGGPHRSLPGVPVALRGRLSSRTAMILAAVTAGVVLVGAGITVGALSAGGDGQSGGPSSKGPGPRTPAAVDEVSPSEPLTETPTPSSVPTWTDDGIAYLTELEQVLDEEVETGPAKVGGTEYPNSVYSTGCTADPFAFDLGRDWSKLVFRLGLKDDSKVEVRHVTIKVDNIPVIDEDVVLGKDKQKKLDVTGVLRLTIIPKDDVEICHEESPVVIANARLEK